MSDLISTPSYILRRPERQRAAAVFSSPHSGRDYPAAFLAASQLDTLAVRSSEDAFVDRLIASAPGLGAATISACYPRALVDLNRAAEELDPALIEGVMRGPHNPRVASGLGVIPRVVSGGRAIYRGKLGRAEAEARLTGYWRPYHQILNDLLEQTHAAFGEVLLIDCHSMPHEAIEAHARPGVPRPDVVLGDRFGAAAAGGHVALIEQAFKEAGLRVARNAPFAGAYIAQAYGRPSRGMHVVQIEIDRGLYMNEARVEPRPDFETFRALIGKVVEKITDFPQFRQHPDIRLAAE